MALPASNCVESTQELEHVLDVKLAPANLICVNPRVLGGRDDQRVVFLDKPSLTLGRSDTNDIVIKASGVSRSHARFWFDGAHWLVEDLKSSNGVFVNKSSLKTSGLSNGDIISVGSVHYKYQTEANAGDIVSDSERQVSLFDVESTLALPRQEIETAVDDHKPARLDLPPDDNKQANITIAIALAAVVLCTLVITVLT